MEEKSEVKRTVYCFWTGDNQMSKNRSAALQSMKDNIGVDVCFLDRAAIEEYVGGIDKLHPAYKYLSCNHKSDYLRPYFMHHFGGGYCDIKHISKDNNWKEQFDLIESNKDLWVIGGKEIPTGSPYQEYNREPNLSKMLCNCWFICRKNTDFTKEWYNRVCKVLDARMDDLIKFPATEPFGGPDYKLRWPEVQAEVFHQLLFEKNDMSGVRIKSTLRSGGSFFKPYR